MIFSIGKGMKKKEWIALLAGLLLAVAASAQPQAQIAGILARLRTDRISLHFSCVFTADVPVALAGTLLLQGECYRAQGSGMEIYCDGTTRWTVDPEAKEVYIETAEGLEELYAMRDALSEVKISDLNYLPLSDDLSAFRYDTSVLGPDWVVTDLR